jgi:hypothetical protein
MKREFFLSKNYFAATDSVNKNQDYLFEILRKKVISWMTYNPGKTPFVFARIFEFDHNVIKELKPEVIDEFGENLRSAKSLRSKKLRTRTRTKRHKAARRHDQWAGDEHSTESKSTETIEFSESVEVSDMPIHCHVDMSEVEITSFETDVIKREKIHQKTTILIENKNQNEMNKIGHVLLKKNPKITFETERTLNEILAEFRELDRVHVIPESELPTKIKQMNSSTQTKNSETTSCETQTITNEEKIELSSQPILDDNLIEILKDENNKLRILNSKLKHDVDAIKKAYDELKLKQQCHTRPMRTILDDEDVTNPAFNEHHHLNYKCNDSDDFF